MSSQEYFLNSEVSVQIAWGGRQAEALHAHYQKLDVKSDEGRIEEEKWQAILEAAGRHIQGFFRATGHICQANEVIVVCTADGSIQRSLRIVGYEVYGSQDAASFLMVYQLDSNRWTEQQPLGW